MQKAIYQCETCKTLFHEWCSDDFSPLHYNIHDCHSRARKLGYDYHSQLPKDAVWSIANLVKVLYKNEAALLN